MVKAKKKTKKINKNASQEYRVLAKVPRVDPSIKEVFEQLYSGFAFRVVSQFFADLAKNLLLKKLLSRIRRQKAADFKLRFARQVDEDVSHEHLIKEFSSWILLQSVDSKNQGNVFLPQHISHLDLLHKVVSNYALHRSALLSAPLKQKEADNFARELVRKLNPAKILPTLHKYHKPPLLQENPTKYFVRTRDEGRWEEFKDEKVTLTLVSKHHSMMNQLPVEDILIGYTLQEFSDLVFIRLQQLILKKMLTRIKKKFSALPKKKDQDDMDALIFQTLTYYDLFGVQPFSWEMVHIKNKKLERMYKSAVEIVGSPSSTQIPYFGLFPGTEQYFGSLGSSFDVCPQAGTYSLRLPASYLLVNHFYKKAYDWLLTAEKGKKKLTILFWYPNFRFLPASIGDVEITDNDNMPTANATVLKFSDKEVLPLLEKNKFLKEKFTYFPGKDLAKSSKDGTYKVFVLSTK